MWPGPSAPLGRLRLRSQTEATGSQGAAEGGSLVRFCSKWKLTGDLCSHPHHRTGSSLRRVSFRETDVPELLRRRPATRLQCLSLPGDCAGLREQRSLVGGAAGGHLHLNHRLRGVPASVVSSLTVSFFQQRRALSLCGALPRSPLLALRLCPSTRLEGQWSGRVCLGAVS